MGFILPARLVAACLFAVTFCAAPVMAASDYYLKIDGIDGESRLEQGGIDILAFSHDVKSPRDSASGLATGRRQHKPILPGPDGSIDKVNMSDISFSCVMGKATPKLMLACATGQHIPQAILTCRKAGTDQPYLKITMKDLIVSSYASSGQGGDEAPADNFSLNFTSVEFAFYGGDPSEIVVKFVVKK